MGTLKLPMTCTERSTRRALVRLPAEEWDW